MAINAGAPVKIKGTSITTPQATGANHTLVLGQLKETTEIAQRLRGDPGDSFVRVNELVSALGARLVNGTVQPPLPGTAAAITVANSILGAGTLAAPLTLDGDTSAPGNTMLYGTNGSGIKGWYAQPAAGTTSPLTTKGDLWGWSTTNVRVPVGTNGKVLTADSTNTAGVSWQTNAASGVGPAGPAIFLAGEPGEDGERGPPGSPGATGTPGSTGAQGPTGPPIFLEADAGADGDMGPPGATGATGTPGSTGAQGPTGPPIYLVGDSGDDGEHGPPGSTGAQGPQGTTGTTGNTGAQGPTGPPIFLEADAGADGDPGPPGATGPQGAAGTNGAPGSTGAQGPMGPPIFLEADSYIPDESISYAATIYGAAPSVGIGLTGKNGIAITYMRSDAAPALDQSIAPTWVGTHVFNSGTMFPAQVTAGADLGGVLVSGAQNNIGLTINNTQTGATANWRISSSATGSGFPAGNLNIGTGSSDFLTIYPTGTAVFSAGLITNQAGYQATAVAATQINALTVSQTGQAQWVLFQPASSDNLNFFGNGATRAQFFGTGGLNMGFPTGGDKGAGTINAVGLYVQGTAVSTAVSANPSASVGLSAVNGAAATFMRSDGAPALDVTIAPTWTGHHTWSGSSLGAGGENLTVVSTSTASGGLKLSTATADNQFIALVNTKNASTSFAEIAVQGGSSASNVTLTMFNPNTPVLGGAFAITGFPAGEQGLIGAMGNFPINFVTNTTWRGAIAANGGWTIGATSGTPASQGAGTLAANQLYVGTVPMYQTGTFTGTLTGMTAATTGTVSYMISGKTCTLSVTLLGTSNTTAMTMTGLPAVCQPATQDQFVPCTINDNATNVGGAVRVSPASGTLVFFRTVLATGSISTTGFTAASTKGLNLWAVTYSLL